MGQGVKGYRGLHLEGGVPHKIKNLLNYWSPELRDQVGYHLLVGVLKK